MLKTAASGKTGGASLVLVAATAIVKGGGTAGDVTEANITSIGGVAIANITIGNKLVFSCDSTGNAFASIAGDSDNNTLTAKKDNNDSGA